MKFMSGREAADELGLPARLVELVVLPLNFAMALSSRPKAFTMAWPVNISSTWPLSSPMFFHCAAKYFWER